MGQGGTCTGLLYSTILLDDRHLPHLCALSPMDWHILSNETAGQGKAADYVSQLLQLIKPSAGSVEVHRTQWDGHAGELGTSILSDSKDDTSAVIAVVGGDGTLHELLNGIHDQLQTTHVNLVLIPSGTANAFYHSLFPATAADPDTYDRFLSAKAALSATPSTAPLSLLSVSPSSSDHRYYSHVVASTALHAQILETASSPEMRAKHPGTARFRAAAELHIGSSYAAELTLHPHSTQGVQRWSLRSRQWETVSQEALHLGKDTSYTYFISALVDRFEAQFRIGPFSSPSAGRPADAVDVLLVKSMPGLSKEQEGKRLFQILMAACEDGKHLLLTESPNGPGADLEVDGAGDQVVEYFRVSGYDWKPVRLLRADRGTSPIC